MVIQRSKAIFVRTCQNLVLLGIGIAVALLCGEILVRYVAPQNLYRFPKGMFVNHPSLKYRLTPNFRGTAKTSEYKTDIRTNAVGLREDKEYGRKSPNAYRILALGDSFTTGVGVNLSDTYVKVLERLLKSGNNEQGFEVINAGVPGYNTRQELEYLKEEGFKFEPDLVLLNFYIGNDIHENTVPSSLFVDDGYLTNEKHSGFIRHKIRVFLARKTHLYNFIWPYQRRLLDQSMEKHERENLVRYMSIYALQEDERTVGTWNATQEQLRDLAKLTKRHGVELIVVIIPELIQTDPRRWVELVQHSNKNGIDYQIDHPNKMIVDVCKKLGVPVLDLLPTFTHAQRSELLYLELDRHWTTSGNALAAKAVQAFLREQLSFPVEPAAQKRRAPLGDQK